MHSQVLTRQIWRTHDLVLHPLPSFGKNYFLYLQSKQCESTVGLGELFSGIIGKAVGWELFQNNRQLKTATPTLCARSMRSSNVCVTCGELFQNNRQLKTATPTLCARSMRSSNVCVTCGELFQNNRQLKTATPTLCARSMRSSNVCVTCARPVHVILARDRVCVCVVWCAMMASTRATVVDDSTPSTSSVAVETENTETLDDRSDAENSSEESDSDTTEAARARSLMTVLRCAQPAAISRKRKVRNNPPTGKKRSCRRSLSDSKSVTPSQRVKEHPGETLCVSNAKLFCRACREELCLKANVLKNHLKSKKHEASKHKLDGKEARERDIAVALQKHNEATHVQGETLPMDQQVYRVSVLTESWHSSK